MTAQSSRARLVALLRVTQVEDVPPSPVAKHHGLTLWDSEAVKEWVNARNAMKDPEPEDPVADV